MSASTSFIPYSWLFIPINRTWYPILPSTCLGRARTILHSAPCSISGSPAPGIENQGKQDRQINKSLGYLKTLEILSFTPKLLWGILTVPNVDESKESMGFLEAKRIHRIMLVSKANNPETKSCKGHFCPLNTAPFSTAHSVCWLHHICSVLSDTPHEDY